MSGLTLNQLPGTKRSPKTLLHQLLEGTDSIEAILVGVLWKGEPQSLDTFWSDTTNMRLVFMERGIHLDVTGALNATRRDRDEIDGGDV
jgi:hypothetical protein